MSIKKIVAVAVAPLVGSVMGGCVPRQVREDARVMSVYTQRVQREAEQFASYRDNIAKARTRNMGYLEESALAGEQSITSQLLVWRMAGDKDRLTLFQGVLEGTALAARQQEETAEGRDAHSKAVEEAHGGVEVRQQQLSKTAEALAQLADKPDLKAEREFYIGFIKEVRKHLDEAQTAAAKQTESATAEAAAKAPGPASPNPED